MINLVTLFQMHIKLKSFDAIICDSIEFWPFQAFVTKSNKGATVCVCVLSFCNVHTECSVVLRCSTEWRRFDGILCTSIWMCVKVNSILYGGKVILLIIYYVCAPICGLFCSFSAPKRCNITSAIFSPLSFRVFVHTVFGFVHQINFLLLLLAALINQTYMLVNIILVLFSMDSP